MITFKRYLCIVSCLLLPAGVPLLSRAQSTLFDDTYVHEIRLELPVPGWYDTLCQYYEDGMGAPKKKVLPAKVSIDGNLLSDSVAMRFKGYYSFSAFPVHKKPIKLKFSKFNDNQHYELTEKLNLNNFAGDPSFMREFCAYNFYHFIGIEAPRIAFTRLYINDEYFGCYAILEEPEDKYFLKAAFGEGLGNLFEPDEASDLSWKGADPAAYDDLKLQTKKNPQAWNKLITWLNLCNNYYGADFAEKLFEEFNVEKYLTVLATETLFDNWDTYAGNARNFYLYDDPHSGKIEWIPWDYNLCLWNKSQPLLPEGLNGHTQILIQRIQQNRYLTRLYLKTVCKVAQKAKDFVIEDRVQQCYNVIRQAVLEDTMKFYSNAQFEENIWAGDTMLLFWEGELRNMYLPGVVTHFHQRAEDLVRMAAEMDCDCSDTANDEALLSSIVYPNPVHDILTICFEDQIEKINIALTSAEGKMVRNEQRAVIGGVVQINTKALSPGMYMLNITSGRQFNQIRIVKY